MPTNGKPRTPLPVETLTLKVPALAKTLCAYLNKCQLDPTPTLNRAIQRRLEAMFGLKRYSGVMHGGDLRLRYKAMKIGADRSSSWANDLIEQGYTLYFGTVMMLEGQTYINDRQFDLVKFKKKWSNFIVREIKRLFTDVQIFAFLDLVAVRDQRDLLQMPFYDFHIHFVLAVKGPAKSIKTLRDKGKKIFRTSTMPNGSFWIREIRKNDTAQAVSEHIAYMLKPPLWHMVVKDRLDGRPQASKSRKRSLSGILFALEHLRLFDLKSLFIVTGSEAMTLKKAILEDLHVYHEKNAGKVNPLDDWKNCSRCKRKVLRLGQPFDCDVNACDLKALEAMRATIAKRRKLQAVPPAPVALTTGKEKVLLGAIRHGAIESL